MFSCCDLCYKKYLNNEQGHPVNEEALKMVNEQEIGKGVIDKPKAPQDVCRCDCHVIGITVMH